MSEIQPISRESRQYIGIYSINAEINDVQIEEAFLHKTSKNITPYINDDLIRPWIEFRKKYKEQHGAPPPPLAKLLSSLLDPDNFESLFPDSFREEEIAGAPLEPVFENNNL